MEPSELLPDFFSAPSHEGFLVVVVVVGSVAIRYSIIRNMHWIGQQT
jgi:hypothetical protein